MCKPRCVPVALRKKGPTCPSRAGVRAPICPGWAVTPHRLVPHLHSEAAFVCNECAGRVNVGQDGVCTKCALDGAHRASTPQDTLGCVPAERNAALWQLCIRSCKARWVLVTRNYDLTLASLHFMSACLHATRARVSALQPTHLRSTKLGMPKRRQVTQCEVRYSTGLPTSLSRGHARCAMLNNGAGCGSSPSHPVYCTQVVQSGTCRAPACQLWNRESNHVSCQTGRPSLVNCGSLTRSPLPRCLAPVLMSISWSRTVSACVPRAIGPSQLATASMSTSTSTPRASAHAVRADWNIA
jgi:hypothetical protein